MPNREERSWRHYSINVTGGCLTNIIQSFSQLDLQIFFTVPKGHNCKKQPLNWQIEIPSRNLSTIESTAIVPQIDVTLLSLLQFPVVIFVILLSKRSSYWQTIRRPLPAPVLSPARFFLVCLSFWPSQLDTVPNEVSLLLPPPSVFSLEEFLLYDMPTKGSPIHKQKENVATHAFRPS